MTNKDKLISFSIKGSIKTSEKYLPLANVNLVIRGDDGQQIGSGTTDEKGIISLEIQYPTGKDLNQRANLTITDREGRIIDVYKEIPLIQLIQDSELSLIIPEDKSHRLDRRTRQIKAGQILIDARLLKAATPELVYDIARMMLNIKKTRNVPSHIAALNPDIFNVKTLLNPLSAQIVFQTVQKIIEKKGLAV